MKTKINLFFGLLLLSFIVAGENITAPDRNLAQKGSINVYASSDLFELALNWATEYGLVNPNQKINVLKSVSDKMPDQEMAGSGIGITGDLSKQQTAKQQAWMMVVGHDVIVPVMNVKNPMLDEICREGISPAGFLRLSGKIEKQSWLKLLVNSADKPDFPIHYYYMDDPEVVSGMNRFLNARWINPKGTKVANVSEMIAAIQNDPAALGFCKLIQVTDQANQVLVGNIKLVPIDKNGNGKIDFMEDIYSNLQTFSRGVWIGKYPKALSGNIYAVSNTKPRNESELAFLKWVLTDGQKFVNANGFSNLAYNERKAQLEKIGEPETHAALPNNSSHAIVKLILIVFLSLITVGFILDRMFRHIRNIRETELVHKSHLLPVLDENSIVIPKGIYFDKTHTWAFMKKNGLVKIGIDDFLQHVIGPVTRIEMKKSGEMLKKGELLLTIVQTGKQLSVYSPITGMITSENKTLKSQSSLLNKAPYAEGWVYLVEPKNWLLEVQFLTMAEKYKTWLNDEFSRLKDFLAKVLKGSSTDYELVVLQDGGALKDCVLSGLGPEIWEDFQTEFIDQSK